MNTWNIEYIARGGNFGMNTITADTASQAVAIMNDSCLVAHGEQNNTRARIWAVGACEFGNRSEAEAFAATNGLPIFAGVSK